MGCHGKKRSLITGFIAPDDEVLNPLVAEDSAVMPGTSPCGRTNMRIRGWLGRADQTTKIKGMFVRPEQVADLVARHAEVARARVIATREGEMDAMTVMIERTGEDSRAYEKSIMEVLKLRGPVEIVAKRSLPNDGKVIDDRRVYD